jgi:hypothetical protein
MDHVAHLVVGDWHIETRKKPNPSASFIIKIHENPQNHIGPSTVRILIGV